jgi:hypothetical protein
VKAKDDEGGELGRFVAKFIGVLERNKCSMFEDVGKLEDYVC